MTPLYQRLLGPAWQSLAPPIQQLHTVSSVSRFAGRCRVVRGQNLLARLVAALVGFPEASADQPIEVTLTVQGSTELWVRSFSGRAFSSRQWADGDGAAPGDLLRERFGVVCVGLALAVENANLRYMVRNWSFCGMPMPRWLGPRSIATESVEAGQFKFDVQISHPLTGLIVRYAGLLAPTAAPTDELSAPASAPSG